MDKIQKLDVKNIFLDPKNRKSVEKYAYIIKNFEKTNVQTDKEFQKKFNGFYRVRRNTEWQKIYYTMMENGKSKPLTFEEILRELYSKTGRVEASFASKLLHTLRADMPIWDKFVLQNLGKKMPVCQGEEKIKNAVRIYGEIADWYKQVLQTESVQKKIAEFDEVFPEYEWFSQTKKLDFIIWQIR